MLRDRLNEALKTAIKNKESLRVSTLRLCNAAIKDRDIAARSDGNSDGVSDEDVLGILQKMIKQRKDSIRHYEEGGRMELAEREAGEIAVIEEFLPRQMDEAAIEAAARSVIAELEAGSLKDMGRTMAALKERHAGEMDFSRASGIVKGLLGG